MADKVTLALQMITTPGCDPAASRKVLTKAHKFRKIKGFQPFQISRDRHAAHGRSRAPPHFCHHFAPDAGKTTLTEKLLLFSGAIRSPAASRRAKASRHATSGLDGDRKAAASRSPPR